MKCRSQDHILTGNHTLITSTDFQFQNSNYNTITVTDEPIKTLKLELKRLLDGKISDHSNVNNLGEDIYFQVLPPTWWKQFEICFKYYAYAKHSSYQYKPDTHRDKQWTELFRDTTQCNAIRACLMSWSYTHLELLTIKIFGLRVPRCISDSKVWEWPM